MSKKHFLIPSIIIVLIISIIILLIPIKIQNELGFIITFLYYLIFNMLSLFVICKNTSSLLKKDMLNVSVIYIYIFLNIITIVFLIFSKLIFINTSIVVILNLILALISFILLFFLINGNKLIINQEEKIVNKTKRVSDLETRVEILLNNCTDKDIKKDLTNLYETVKYMDPVENDVTSELDIKIDNLLKKIEKNIDINSIKELIKLINERKVIIENNK
ncbi:MAG TPA: hypothetical protein IAB38_01350 [Candidatus Onthousia excrementipullorum]|uniref:Uncharacterized protein n=1 Tax=Candidatus Onthousia excrementipullorum TaxID=2840884 RepID=A0A9D1J314_9FIRM|nr:hypothetical protein [Candidatus Onthousia excrementipullorum]